MKPKDDTIEAANRRFNAFIFSVNRGVSLVDSGLERDKERPLIESILDDTLGYGYNPKEDFTA